MNPLYRAKMSQKGFFPGRADSGDLVERRAFRGLALAFALEGDRKAVGFISGSDEDEELC